jgi:hypothetical protein
MHTGAFGQLAVDFKQLLLIWFVLLETLSISLGSTKIKIKSSLVKH